MNSTLYKSRVLIGNKEHVVVNVNYKQEEQMKETTVDRLHHIHMLDRSWSMSRDIDKLIDNVQETFDMMADNDIISVIWFSGADECKTLLKGASKSMAEDVKTLLDTIRSCVGITCFSEPLKEASTIVDELSMMCSNFSVTLFTDGCAVVPWSYEEEKRRIVEQLDILSDKVMAVNTIGYGYYYDEELLKMIADSSMFGKFIHSNKIADYTEIFSHNYEILSDMVSECVEIGTQLNDVLYLTPNNTTLKNGDVQLRFLNKTKNQFFIICDSEFVFSINGESVSSETITKKIPKASLRNFYYAYAYEKYYAGESDVALDCLIQTGDKGLIDRLLNAFTSDERADYQKSLREAVFKNRRRYKDGEVDASYVPAKDAFCIMDLFRILSTGENFYVPNESNYKRVGLKVDDKFNLFTATKDQVIEAPLDDLVFNTKHLNLSIRMMINGTVQLNPREAKKVDLPLNVPARSYKTHTIINDGNLNVEKLTVRVDDETQQKLLGLKTLPEDLYITTLENGNVYLEFDLKKLPLINRMYAEIDDVEDVLRMSTRIETLKAKQKVLRYYESDIKAHSAAANKTGEFKSYNKDQINVLKDHGINYKGDYQGGSRQVADRVQEDFYEVRLLEFTLKGWSALPKVDDVLSKKKKNAPAMAMLTECNTLMDGDLIKANKANSLAIDKRLSETKDELKKLRMDLDIVKMAKVLTGGWWKGLEVDTKGNFTYTDGINTLVIKSDRIKKFY